MKTSTLFLSATAALAFAAPAAAQDYYISGSVGLLDQSSSSNEGQTGAFTTGNIGDGTTIDVATGTDYGWETEFDSGMSYAVEVGKRKASGLRLAIEAVKTSADVDTHTGVTLGGGDIGGLDASALAGFPNPLGATVSAVVADGRGDIDTKALFLNAYYDVNLDSAITPYVGLGLGVADVDVLYAPSAVPIIDDGQTKFAYQGKAGVSVGFSDAVEVFGEAAYRRTGDIETDNTLFPGSLDVENKQLSFSAGLRFTFGG